MSPPISTPSSRSSAKRARNSSTSSIGKKLRWMSVSQAKRFMIPPFATNRRAEFDISLGRWPECIVGHPPASRSVQHA